MTTATHRCVIWLAVLALTALTACGDADVADELTAGVNAHDGDPSLYEADLDPDPDGHADAIDAGEAVDANADAEATDDPAADADGAPNDAGPGDTRSDDGSPVSDERDRADAGGICASDDCALLVADGAPLDDATYLARIGEINLAHERIVQAMEAELSELEAGIHDGPSLADALEALAEEAEEARAGAADLAPLPGAERWHERALAPWEGVCVGLADGIAGAADGDMERFEAYVDALRTFPALANDLHATMMVGPFEEG